MKQKPHYIYLISNNGELKLSNKKPETISLTDDGWFVNENPKTIIAFGEVYKPEKMSTTLTNNRKKKSTEKVVAVYGASIDEHLNKLTSYIYNLGMNQGGFMASIESF